MRSSFENLTPAADRALSRLHAKKIAEALGSKVVRERKTVIGEPTCDYKVPCHLVDFWCKAKISEVTVLFQSNHKMSAPTPFCFSLAPWRNMATDIEVAAAGPLIGQSVFRTHDMDEQPLLESLADARVRAELGAIVREGVTFLFCSSSQLLAEFDSLDAAVSVRRIRAFQSLQLALYESVHR